MTASPPPDPAPRHAGHHLLGGLQFPVGEHGSARGRIVRQARLGAWLLVVALLTGLAGALLVRRSADAKLAERSAQSAVLHVRVVRAGARAPDARLALPGAVQAVLEAQIHARTTGYVREWKHDIGDTVRQGEVLAVLDVPEVNRQLQEAQANLELARTAFDRWTRLRTQDAVSQQELDEKLSAFRQAQAVELRLRDQVGFSRVVAPFDGIVTRRNVNVGDLVNSGNGGDPQALFSMARTGVLHAYVYVPQERAPDVRVGDAVQVVRPERPGEAFAGRIARTSGAIDPATRTLQVDIEIPAPGRGLLPGTYVEARWTPGAASAPTLPSSALLIDSAGVRVAVVKDGKAHLQKVVPGTDYGAFVAIRDGIAPTDDVIVYPPESIEEGQPIVVEAAAAPVAAPTAAPKAP